MYNKVSRIAFSVFRKDAAAVVDGWLEAFVNKNGQNMNPYVRWELLIVGCVFLGVTFDIQTRLNWLVLLPLLSIYLIQASIIGYEPIYSLLQQVGKYLHSRSLLQKPQSMTNTSTAFMDKH
jgi:hypothetical protein